MFSSSLKLKWQALRQIRLGTFIFTTSAVNPCPFVHPAPAGTSPEFDPRVVRQSPASGRLDVFRVGHDSHLRHIWFDSAGRHPAAALEP